MSALKDTLCLLAILIAYGIAGRMDYDDAVMLDEARRTTAVAECPTDETLKARNLEAQAIDPPFDPRFDSADASTPESDVPCTSHTL